MPTLLIGAPTRGLAGIDADLELVAAMVTRLGLDAPVVLRNATLALIRAQLAELLARTRPGDRVFLYLTGHGGVVTNRNYSFRDVRPAPQRLYYFSTVAEDSGRPQGLFDVELSLWCARLASKTANVVVVVDSCHSGGLVRDDATDQAFVEDFERWRDVHRDEIDTLDVEAHPDVVRLSAAGVNGVARPGADGSALTQCLVAALAEEGALRASWLTLFARIEARLIKSGVAQEPRLSGPVRRRVFELEVTLPPGAFAVRLDGEQLVLVGGAQQGVVRGDLFLLAQAGAEHWVEVGEVQPTTAVLQQFAATELPLRLSPAAFAVPLRLRGQATASVTGSEPVKRSVEAALTGAGWSAAPPGDRSTRASITCSTTAMTVRDRAGELSAEVAEPSQCIDALRRFARVDRLQSLGGVSLASLGLRVTWGRVRGGVCEPLTAPEVELQATDPVYVRVENAGDVRRFVSVFWIADDGEGCQLSRSESMGVELGAKTTYLLGDRPFARMPRGVIPPRRPMLPGERRRERLVIVATTRRQALWSFDTAHAQGGVRRSVDLAGTEVFRFTVIAPATLSAS